MVAPSGTKERVRPQPLGRDAKRRATFLRWREPRRFGVCERCCDSLAPLRVAANQESDFPAVDMEMRPRTQQ